jgi:hypothetical protein
MAEDAPQFASQPQGLPSIGLVALTDSLERFGPHIAGQRKMTIQMRHHAMVLGELSQPLPVERMNQEVTDSLGTFAVRKLGTAGEQQIELWTRGEDRRRPQWRLSTVSQGGDWHAQMCVLRAGMRIRMR